MVDQDKLKESLYNYLIRQTRAVSLKKLTVLFDIKDEREEELLCDALNELINENRVVVGKRGLYQALPETTGPIVGTISINMRGKASLIGSGVTIKREGLNGALSGDRVLIKGSKDQRYVAKILSRTQDLITCEVIEEDGVKYLKPISSNETIKVNVSPEELDDFVDGDRIIVKLKESDKVFKKVSQRKIKKGKYTPEELEPVHEGTVLRKEGHRDDPDQQIKTVAIKHGFYSTYPEDVEEELKSIPNEVTEEEMVGRRDLRSHITFTIDGKDTKDMDDAVEIELLDNGHKILRVHIADVSHYVKPNSPLFNEARRRGTSLYILDKVVAMLPHKLSNGICSLNPGKDRLTKTCEIEFDENGRVINSEVYRSVIRSRKKMNYDDVNSILEDGIVPEGYEDYKDILIEMAELASILEKKSIKRGKINIGSNDVKTKTDEFGRLVEIKPNYQRTAESLIENFMVAANEQVAKKFHQLPFIYRCHKEPDDIRVFNVFDIVKNLIPSIRTPREITGKKIEEFLESIRDRKEYKPISFLILRAMKKAVYSDNNDGHFGLGLLYYTHFTSPIRRFSDLVVHSLIDLYIDHKEKLNDKDFVDNLANLVRIDAEQATAREYESESAEKEGLKLALVDYMGERIGNSYIAQIIGTDRNGMQILINDCIEGVVCNRDIEGDGKVRYSSTYMNISKGRNLYNLGDYVEVEMLEADKGHSEIKFRAKRIVSQEEMDKLNTKGRQLIKS